LGSVKGMKGTTRRDDVYEYLKVLGKTRGLSRGMKGVGVGGP
jgi:hypothetical protein